MRKVQFTMLLLATITLASCNINGSDEPTSDTGVKKAHAKIKVGSDGLTAEQRNIKHRLEEDNKIGAIKHLYVISAMSGEVIIYSTVDGKVTSGGKRLTNVSEIIDWDEQEYVLPSIQDDGTYGSSMNYLYWWDAKGNYHQHYVTGGQIVHISDQAMPVTEISINLSK